MLLLSRGLQHTEKSLFETSNGYAALNHFTLTNDRSMTTHFEEISAEVIQNPGHEYIWCMG